MIRHHRGNRRDMTETKAKRKANIVHMLGDYWYYPHFGQYRKGKIHCSCPMCAAKTNTSINKSRGPVYKSPVDPDTGLSLTGNRGSRLTLTNYRLGKKNYKHSDRKKVEGMLEQLKTYDIS